MKSALRRASADETKRGEAKRGEAMNAWKVGLLVLCALGMPGCLATGMSQTECLTADWRALGYQDGRNGATTGRFATRANQCIQFGEFADEALYTQGRQAGLTALCTPLGGLEFGRDGRGYQGVCPPHTEFAFLEAYEIGYEYHRLQSDLYAAEDALDRAFSSINSAYRDRREKQYKLDESPDEPYREKKARQIRDIDERLDSLDDQILYLRRQVRRAERAFYRFESEFFAYEAALRQSELYGHAPRQPAY